MRRLTTFSKYMAVKPGICCEILMELQIIGSGLPLFSMALIVTLIFFSLISGELINPDNLGFEVIFPFFTAIAVGEWGKTRADTNYDVIAAQGKSLFRWVLIRYLAVSIICSLFALAGMAAISFTGSEIAMWELIYLYFPTAFLLSSLAMLTGLVYNREHMASLVCGLVWLASLMLRSLLRFPGFAYFYLFIRFAGVDNGVWLANKGIMCLVSLGIWGLIYRICQKGSRH